MVLTHQRLGLVFIHSGLDVVSTHQSLGLGLGLGCLDYNTITSLNSLVVFQIVDTPSYLTRFAFTGGVMYSFQRDLHFLNSLNGET